MTYPSRHRHRIVAFLMGGAVCVCAGAADAEWIVDVGAGAAYNSNLTRAQDPQDRRPDRSLTFAVSVARHEVFTGSDGLTYGIDLRGEVYDRYHGLNFIGIGASANYRHKFGLGTKAPYGVLAASISHDNYRVDVRDSNLLDLRAELGRRFSETFDVSIGLSYEQRDARTDVPIVPGISGAIFDLRGYGAFIRADQALDERWLIGARVAVRRGDVESTSQRSRAVFLASDAIAADPAFNDPLLIGYRLRGSTRSIAGTLGYALSDRAVIDVAYVDERTHAAQSLTYRNRIATAGFVYRF